MRERKRERKRAKEREREREREFLPWSTHLVHDLVLQPMPYDELS